MPRLTRKFPAYRLHKASGQAMVSIHGRVRYLGAYGSAESKAAYLKLKKEWAAEEKARAALAPAKPLSKDPSLNEVLLAYWRHCERRYRRNGEPTRELDNVKAALRHLKPHGTIRASEFGARALIRLREGMVDQGLARRTINARVTKIKGMFSWAVTEELLQPAALGVLAVKGLKRFEEGVKETAKVEPVPLERVRATLPHLPAPIRAMVMVQELTGMRSSEVTIMRGRDIDRDGSVWVYRPAWHKTAHLDKIREVPLGPKAQVILTPWISNDPDAYLFNPASATAARNAKRRQERRSPMTPSQAKRKPKANPQRAPRERYDKRSYYQAIERACAKAFPHPVLDKIKAKKLTAEQANELEVWRKGQRWHPHQLRHTAGTLVRKQYGAEVAQVFLGHSKMSSSEIYCEANTAKVSEVAKKVG